MQHTNSSKVILACAAIVAGSAGVLWSWNTLAELLDGPSAEFRHLIAVLVIVLVLRQLARTGHSRHAAHGRGLRKSPWSLP